jgi:protein-S-isoprenylcysteine O-methyltransferase Ste14
MKPEELARVLSEDADIVPSSGFVAAVMEAVVTEATAPPLAFPWKRAWPLGAAFAVLLLWLGFLQLGPQVEAPGADVYGWFAMIVPTATAWVAGALLVTLALTVWSLRLVRCYFFG